MIHAAVVLGGSPLDFHTVFKCAHFRRILFGAFGHGIIELVNGPVVGCLNFFALSLRNTVRYALADRMACDRGPGDAVNLAALGVHDLLNQLVRSRLADVLCLA
ncbi:hypothetical protein SDC9_132133 [bioreactor metagenome]|uniref:Uncharacterized protein n=1 Tax=bioreactor metagenome TaxID=1076179 RepID=A0A645D6Q6_9ZZZZ